MTYWLISTKYPKDNKRKINGQILIFLDDKTGKIIEKKVDNHNPYFYTTLKEKDIMKIEKVQKLQYVIKNNYGEWTWNRAKVIRAKEIEMYHPRTREKIRVTKVETTNPIYVTNKGKTGLSQLIFPEFVFNNHIPYADVFNIDNDITIGMPYNIETLKMDIDWEKIKKHEIYNLKELQKYKKILPLKAFNWAMAIFTTPFPELKKHIIAIDIECDFNYRDAIDPYTAIAPVSSITISHYLDNDEIKHVTFILSNKTREREEKKFELKHKNHKIMVYDDEYTLLKEASTYLLMAKQKIVVGFNIDSFDIPYIVTRMQYLNCKNDKIWGHKYKVKDKDDVEIEKGTRGIKGKFMIDLYEFFKNPSIKNYAFKGKYEKNSLDSISEALLNEKKYQYEKTITDLSLKELAYYNAKDNELVLKLATHDNEIVMQLIMITMRIGTMTIESACRRYVSAVLLNLIRRMLHYHNMIEINKPQLAEIGEMYSRSSTGKNFAGAIVIEPERGVHENLVVADVSSLYPSMIINNNICYSTMNCNHEECKENKFYPLIHLIEDDEGEEYKKVFHHICKKEYGINSSIVGFIKDVRVFYFKKYKNKVVGYKAVEQYLKVIINASYGLYGFQQFPYFCGPAAETVTSTARDTIMNIKSYFEKKGANVIYGDSVTGDTPIIIKNEYDEINVIEIKNLEKYDITSRKIYIWTENGWTQILGLHKHTTKKKIYRILTYDGCVDVTEDHSLLLESGNIIKPDMITPVNRLLKSFPQVSKKQIELLLERNMYFIPIYNDLKAKTHQRIYTLPSKRMAQIVYLLAKSLGYCPYIQTMSTSIKDFYIVGILSEKGILPKNTRVMLLREKVETVYDITTENSHFHAGIGEIIVHNTDSVFLTNLDESRINEYFKEIKELYGVDMAIEEKGYSIVLAEKKNYLIVERKDNGKIDTIIAGLVGKKKHVPKIIRNAFDEWVEIIKNNLHSIKDIEKTLSLLETSYSSYQKAITNKMGDISDYSIRLTMSKVIDEYKSNTPQVRAAIKLFNALQSNTTHRLDRNMLFKKGTVIEFIYTYPDSRKQSYKEPLPLEIAKIEDINPHEYLKILDKVYHQLVSPIKEQNEKIKNKTNKVYQSNMVDFFAN